VVALVDKFTGSAAELSTLIVKAMPNGHVIGERTMGSISPMGGDNRVFNGGPFDGGKFWTRVNCAFLEVRDLDNHINEKVGIPPDEEVAAQWNDFLKGKDHRLEAAIHYIDPNHVF
jgi:C-terminal processing protease CtpA/Prc